MPYQIDIKENQILVITFSGESDLEENERAREELAKINKEVGSFKIIADWRSASISKSVMLKDFLSFATDWPKPVNANSFIVAVLLSRTNKTPHFGVDFSNKVAKNKGLTSRMFWEIDDAFNWLETLSST